MSESEWTDESESEAEMEEEIIKVVRPRKKVNKKVEIKNEIIDEPVECEKVSAEQVEAPKPKRTRSKAQEEAWKKCLAKRKENREKRLAIKTEEEQKYKKQAEEKIVKKAVRIKKKQAVRQAVLEDVSSESESDELDVKAVKRVVKKKQQKKKATEPPPNPVLERSTPSLVFY